MPKLSGTVEWLRLKILINGLERLLMASSPRLARLRDWLRRHGM